MPSLAALFHGVEAVVHSAYIPSGERDVYSVSPPQIERFDAEFDNIRMAQRVYRCALEAGVRRVVVVSSNHAADWYEHNEVHSRRRETVHPTDSRSRTISTVGPKRPTSCWPTLMPAALSDGAWNS